MPVKHRAHFKQTLSILRQLKHQENTAHQHLWKSYSSSWWNWQKSWWYSSCEHHHENAHISDWSEKLDRKVTRTLFRCMIFIINLLKYSSKFGKNQRSLLSPTGGVNIIPPIHQNLGQNGYDENKNYDESYENKCSTNYSIITNNNNWNDTHNKQLTMQNKYTNDDVDFDDCVVHIMRWVCTQSALFHIWWWHRTPHGSSSESIHSHPRSYSWRILFDSTSTFFLYLSFLPFSVFFVYPELFLELDNPIVMTTLRYSASDESEDTLNSCTSHTGKDVENCRYTLQPMWKRLRLSQNIFANELTFYGAVEEICAENESLHERTVRPVVMGQSGSSLVLGVIKTEILCDCDDPANKNFSIATTWKTNWEVVTTR